MTKRDQELLTYVAHAMFLIQNGGYVIEKLAPEPDDLSTVPYELQKQRHTKMLGKIRSLISDLKQIEWSIREKND